MIKATLNQKKLDALIKNVKLLRDQVTSTKKIADKKVSEEIRTYLRKRMPKVTGNLRESVTIIQNKDGSFLIGHDRDKTAIANGGSYGDVVYYGIKKGYYIYPKYKKALRFDIGGETIFAKKVFIPPRAGNPFIDNTVNDLVNDQIGTKIYVSEFKKISLLQ